VKNIHMLLGMPYVCKPATVLEVIFQNGV
jgi:hypothetical protein